MATAVSGIVKNEEGAGHIEASRDITSEIADKEQILQMVDSGFDEERVFESREYQLAMEMLEDPRLKGDKMYENLVHRLSAFYLNSEKIRINGGPNEQQRETIRRSGYSQVYRERLHKCLRELLIYIVNERNMQVKLRQLRQCYEWFLQKLVAMGSLSQ
jgi:hypothetical protein